MPDVAQPIMALSWAEVQRIVDRFKSLNPYSGKLAHDSILKVHELNWDKNHTLRWIDRLKPST